MLFLLMLVSLTGECGVSCASVGGPSVRYAQSAHAVSTSWLLYQHLVSARYAHDQALSHIASFEIADSLCDLSVLLFGVWSSQRSYIWLDPDLQDLRERIDSTVLTEAWLEPCFTVFACRSRPGYPLLTGCCKGKQHINALRS